MTTAPTMRAFEILALAALCSAGLLSGGPALAEAPEAGEPAEERFIQAVSPEELGKIVAENGDRPTLINFWATWCPPCLKEMPEFVRFVEEYPDEKVRFLSVSVDHPDTIERRVRPYVEEEDLPFSVWVYAGMPDEAAEHLPFALGGAVPVTVVLDANGEVVRLWEEEIVFDDLETAVGPLLSGDGA